MKHALFRHAGFLSVVVVIATLVSTTQLAGENWQIVISGVGAALSLVYFVQKQKLEELRLFKELFVEFNERYDALQDRLLQIVEPGARDFPSRSAGLSTSTSTSARRSFSFTGSAI